MTQHVQPTPEEARKVEEALRASKTRLMAWNPLLGMIVLELRGVAAGSEVALSTANYREIKLRAVAAGRHTVKDSAGFTKDSGQAYYDLTPRLQTYLLARAALHIALDHPMIPIDFDRKVASIVQDTLVNQMLLFDNTIGVKHDEMPEELPRLHITEADTAVLTVGSGFDQLSFELATDKKRFTWVQLYWLLQEAIEKKARQELGPDAGREALAEKVREFIERLNKLNPLDNAVEPTNSLFTQDRQDRDRFQRAVLGAIHKSKSLGFGKIPAGLLMFMDRIVNPKVRWARELQNLVRDSVGRSDYSSLPNTKLSHIGYFPRMESRELGAIWCALDTSGSMGKDELRRGLSEFDGVRKAHPCDLKVLTADAGAYEVQEFSRYEYPDWTKVRLEGGGGTDFRPVHDKIEQHRKRGGRKPAVLIYVTDGIGMFPEKAPDYPVIWVCTNPGAEFPYGKVLYVED